MNKIDLEANIDRMEKELAEMKEKLKEADEPKLRLFSDCDTLFIKYSNLLIGVIQEDGECEILNTKTKRDNYKEWVENGMKVDSTPVKWRGREYRINNGFYLESMYDGIFSHIYDFEYSQACSICLDTNIVRYEHNKTPILF